MKIGIGLPAAVPGTEMAILGDWAAEAESAGFSAVGVFDRLVYDNVEPLIALAVAAARTRSAELVTTVLNVGWRRNAILLAKQLSCSGPPSPRPDLRTVFLPAPEDETLVTRCATPAKGVGMVGRRSTFTAEPAPCGKIVGGECYRDDDGFGLVVYDQYYRCGCKRTRHEYHDGTVTTTAVRHGRRHKVIFQERSEHPV